jgi:hypothetical protein
LCSLQQSALLSWPLRTHLPLLSTYTTSSMVTDVSAMLVASTSLRTPAAGRWNTYSDEKVANLVTIRHSRDREWLLNIPLGTKLDSGTIYNHAKGFKICPSFKDHFSCRAVPNPNITIPQLLHRCAPSAARARGSWSAAAGWSTGCRPACCCSPAPASAG